MERERGRGANLPIEEGRAGVGAHEAHNPIQLDQRPERRLGVAQRGDIAVAAVAAVAAVGFRVQGSGFRVQGSGFRVQGSGFRVQGSGFRVQGHSAEMSLSLLSDLRERLFLMSEVPL